MSKHGSAASGRVLQVKLWCRVEQVLLCACFHVSLAAAAAEGIKRCATPFPEGAVSQRKVTAFMPHHRREYVGLSSCAGEYPVSRRRHCAG
jgi:hypothetical protein